MLVLGVEDVIIDRLHQFVSRGHRDVAEQAMTLLSGGDQVDRARLARRGKSKRLWSALVELERLLERAIAGERLENYARFDDSGHAVESWSGEALAEAMPGAPA